MARLVTITVPDVDADLLKDQKDALLSTMEQEREAAKDCLKAGSREDHDSIIAKLETLDGLVNLLDWMQDEVDSVPHHVPATPERKD